MDCTRTRDLLSEYIDGALDTKAAAAIEEHLSTCEDCMAELVSLKEVVEELGSLETVKAPADFLGKIHERLEPRSGFDRIVRKLFVPFRIKVPLELAVAATMAVLVFSVYTFQQAERPVEKRPEPALSQKITDKPGTDRSAPALKGAPATPSFREGVSVAKKSMLKALGPKQEKESVPSLPVTEETKEGQPLRQGKGIELALVVETGIKDIAYPPAMAREAATPVEKDAIAYTEKRSDAALSGEKILPGERDGVTVREGDDLLSKVKHLITVVEGNLLTVERDRQTDQIQSITAEIPAKRYGSFRKELALLAMLRPPLPDLPDKAPRTVRIQIRFIQTE